MGNWGKAPPPDCKGTIVSVDPTFRGRIKVKLDNHSGFIEFTNPLNENFVGQLYGPDVGFGRITHGAALKDQMPYEDFKCSLKAAQANALGHRTIQCGSYNFQNGYRKIKIKKDGKW